MPRPKVLTHARFAGAPAPAPDLARRELAAMRDIVHAFLNADRPEEVLQFALDRVSPLIGASFASVYLVAGASELMRLAASFNWPEKHRKWLGEMRLRLGFGPSGEAAAERRIIEVPDVSKDRSLEDWAEIGSELGCRSVVALPLVDASGSLGAVTFYFTEAGSPSDERRNLMRLVADQIAATAAKVNYVDELRRSRATLSDMNAELERQYATLHGSLKATNAFIRDASEQLRRPAVLALDALEALQTGKGDAESPALKAALLSTERLLWRLDELAEFASIRVGTEAPEPQEFDPHDAIEAALRLVEPLAGQVTIRAEPRAPAVRLLRTDRHKTTRLLASLLLTAIQSTPLGEGVEVAEGEVRIGCDLDSGRVRFRMHSPPATAHADAAEREMAAGTGLELARQVARALGGRLEADADGRGLLMQLVFEDPGVESA